VAEPTVKVADAVAGVSRLFLDTAPLIYAIERNIRYVDIVAPVFLAIDHGDVTAVTSPVTLAECLIVPYRLQSAALRQQYQDQIVNGRNTDFVTIDATIADRAAAHRAQYNFSLADAFQVATAVHAHCDTLITNDTILRRVTEIRVLVIDDLEP
jgi:predicted nucleic acid-binding protein